MKNTVNYRPDIDGLRAISVLAVVFYHAFPLLIPGGFIGVDVFFVISGYLITGIIASDLELGRFTFRNFYFRRIRRIFPALAIVIFVTLAIGWQLLLPANYEQLGLHALAGAFFVPNFVLWAEVGYFDAAAETKPLLHLWSLGIEEQFYLVWPALLVAFARRRTLIIALLAIAAASLAYSIYASLTDAAAGFYSPISRLWELALGGILAVAKPRVSSWASTIGLALILIPALTYTESLAFPGLLALVPTVGAGIVVASNSTRLLTFRPLVWLGLVSYPLYLWHWPLLSFAQISGVDTALVRFAIVAVSIALAWATYRYVEKEIRFGRLRAISAPVAISGMIGAAIFATLIAANGGIRSRFPAEILTVIDLPKYDVADQARVPECWLTASAPPEEFSPVCERGSVLIWGDSHAARLYPGLTSIFKEVAQFTRDSCAPILGNRPETCAASNTFIMEAIGRQKPRTVILFAAWLSYWQDWGNSWPEEERFRQTLRQLRRAGVKNIQVLGPAPYWEPSLPEAIYDYWSLNGRLPGRLFPAAKKYHAADLAIQHVTEAEGGNFVSVYDGLCNQQGCATHTSISKSDLLSWDYGHLTTSGAKFVVNVLGLDKAMAASVSD